MMDFNAYLSLQDYITLQGIVSMYLTDMGPTLTHGWYYLRHILLQQVIDGEPISARRRFLQTGSHLSRSAGTVASGIRTYLRNAYLPPNGEQYIPRWREIGWTEEHRPSAPEAIRLLSNGFLPYLKRHHPQEYQEVLDLPLRSFPPGSPQT